MGKARIADRKPAQVDLEPGAHYWCACGHSSSQPFCDGSHNGTGLTPLVYQAEKDGAVFFCGCKASGKKPLCDGTHSKL